MELFKKLIEMDEVVNSSAGDNKILDQLLDCVCLSARVLMNVSHENGIFLCYIIFKSVFFINFLKAYLKNIIF